MALIVVATSSAPALARDGRRGEVRAAGTCSGAATSTLRLRADDGRIEAEFEVEHVRSGSRWRVTIVQERRVVWRGHRSARARAFEVRRTLTDLSGADSVTVRATSGQGVTCSASATLPG